MTLNVEQSVSNSGTGVSSTNLPTWSPAANELLLILVAISGNKTATVSGNGLTYDIITSQAQGGTTGITVSAYRALSATTPTAGVVTINQGSTSAICGIGVRISGVDTSGTNGSGAIGASPVVNNGTGTAATLTKTPGGDNRFLFGTYAYEDQNLTYDDGTFTVLLTDLEAGAGSFITRLAAAYKLIVTAASTAINGTIVSSNSWAGMAIDIVPAATDRRRIRAGVI